RAVFPGVGSELVKREPDGLRRGRLQAQLGAMHGDTRTNEVREMRELGVDQVLDLDPVPFVADEQVLIGRERLDALGETLDEILGIAGDSLVSDRVDDAEHVLGAMIDFAHEEVLFFLPLPALFLALLALANVRNSAGQPDGPSLRPGALEIRKPQS